MKQPDDKSQGYIDTLPQNYSENPLCFGEKELNMLKGTYFGRQVDTLR